MSQNDKILLDLFFIHFKVYIFSILIYLFIYMFNDFVLLFVGVKNIILLFFILNFICYVQIKIIFNSQSQIIHYVVF